MECGVPAVRSGVLAFSGVPHFCISVIVLVVAFHGVPWWSILAWSGDLAFCGVPACRAGLPGVLAFQASLHLCLDESKTSCVVVTMASR